VQTLSLLDGFLDPSEICASLGAHSSLVAARHANDVPSPARLADEILADPRLRKVMSISILPTFPHPSSPFLPPPPAFQLGLQMIPVTNGLQLLAIGLPLDTCTNATSRAHLGRLRLTQLGVTFNRPTEELMAELWSLVGETCRTLSVRYTPPIRSVGHQIQLEPLVDPAVLVRSALRKLPHVVFYLPRMLSLAALPYENQPREGTRPTTTSFAQRLVDLVAVDDELRDKIEVWLVGGVAGLLRGGVGGFDPLDPATPGGGSEEPNERLWPVSVEAALEAGMSEDDRLRAAAGRRRSSAAELDQRNKETWTRQTDLRLLGGLFGVRMESRKTGGSS